MKIMLDSHCFLQLHLGEMRNKEKMNDSKLKHFNPMALRDKYSAKNLNKKNNFSSFWLDNGWDNNSSIFD